MIKNYQKSEGQDYKCDDKNTPCLVAIHFMRPTFSTYIFLYFIVKTRRDMTTPTLILFAFDKSPT